MILGGVLYTVFALLAATGAFLVAAHFRGYRLATALAAGVLAFFVLLAVALAAMVAAFGGPVR